MDWKQIGQSVSKLAPGLGAAIGGPVGAVAGLGVQALCGFFGVSPEAPDAPSLVDEALNMLAPEQAVELKALDNQFVVDMKKLDVDVFKLEVDDRKSARKMQERIKSKVPGIMAVLVTLGFFGLLALLCFYTIPVANAEVLYVMVGALGAGWTQIMNFFFGSSKGSQDKTAILGSK